MSVSWKAGIKGISDCIRWPTKQRFHFNETARPKAVLKHIWKSRIEQLKDTNNHLVQLQEGLAFLMCLSLKIITGTMSVFWDQHFQPFLVMNWKELWFEVSSIFRGNGSTTIRLSENKTQSVFGLWADFVKLPATWCLYSAGRLHYFLPISWCFKDHQYCNVCQQT